MSNADISIATRNSCLYLPNSVTSAGSEDTMSEDWSKIVKLFKKDDSSNCDNWCGIFLSRVIFLAVSYWTALEVRTTEDCGMNSADFRVVLAGCIGQIFTLRNIISYHRIVSWIKCSSLPKKKLSIVFTVIGLWKILHLYSIPPKLVKADPFTPWQLWMQRHPEWLYNWFVPIEIWWVSLMLRLQVNPSLGFETSSCINNRLSLTHSASSSRLGCKAITALILEVPGDLFGVVPEQAKFFEVCYHSSPG